MPRPEPQNESIYHQRAKQAIAAGCQRAGYTPVLEAAGEGWRADVLAVPPSGSGRIAFEVQWSFLRLDECESRQRRYAADGVRGCWFFRQPPRRLSAGGDELCARRELPLFRLWGALDESFEVALNEHRFALDAFVERLLGRGIRFSAQATPAARQRLGAAWLELPCPGCGRPLALAHVLPRLTARCGLVYPAPVAWWDGALARHPTVQAALPPHPRAAAVTAAGWACAGCGAALSPAVVEMALYGTYHAERAHADRSVSVALGAGPALSAPLPHWCPGGPGGFCGG